MGKTNDISWDISDAFAAGIAGECLSEICAFFCRDGVCSDNFKSIIFRVGTEKCRTEDGAGICPGRYPAEQAAGFFEYGTAAERYYERQVKEVVEQMVTELGNSCGVPVQKVEVTLTQDTGAVAQVTVWTAVSGKTIQQEMRRQTAEACGIGEQQVEVYGS